MCNNHKIKQSNVQFSVNQNLALSCTTSFDLTNKQAIGQKAFRRYIEFIGSHVICKHLSGSLHDGSKFEKQELLHLLCVLSNGLRFACSY